MEHPSRNQLIESGVKDRNIARRQENRKKNSDLGLCSPGNKGRHLRSNHLIRMIGCLNSK